MKYKYYVHLLGSRWIITIVDTNYQDSTRPQTQEQGNAFPGNRGGNFWGMPLDGMAGEWQV